MGCLSLPHVNLLGGRLKYCIRIEVLLLLVRSTTWSKFCCWGGQIFFVASKSKCYFQVEVLFQDRSVASRSNFSCCCQLLLQGQSSRQKFLLKGYHLQKKGKHDLVIGGSLCLGQGVLDHLVKILKEELLTGFSPRQGFFAGCPPTSSVFDLCVMVLVIA